MNAMAKCRGTASKDYGEDENVCIAVPRPDRNGNAECDRPFSVMSAIAIILKCAGEPCHRALLVESK